MLSQSQVANVAKVSFLRVAQRASLSSFATAHGTPSRFHGVVDNLWFCNHYRNNANLLP